MENIFNRDRVVMADINALSKKIGGIYGVDLAIHPNDYIFQFELKNPANTHHGKAIENYFEGGAKTTLILKNLINELFPQQKESMSLLEFASGYGRLTRHFARLLPDIDCIACDIHQEAVDYIHSFGGKAILSSTLPEAFVTGQQFDVVFALSFFTHMPRKTWGRWLQVLSEQVAPGGVLIFTTHGQPSLKLMGVPPFNSEGFWFGEFSDQDDLSSADYGNTATSFNYVYRQLAGTPLSLIRFQEAGFGYQDLYIARNHAINNV